MIANPPPPPSWRKPAGVLLIVALIAFWAGAVASLAEVVGVWPIWAQTAFYIVAGTAWVLPLRPLLVWMETPPRSSRGGGPRA